MPAVGNYQRVRIVLPGAIVERIPDGDHSYDPVRSGQGHGGRRRIPAQATDGARDVQRARWGSRVDLHEGRPHRGVVASPIDSGVSDIVPAVPRDGKGSDVGGPWPAVDLIADGGHAARRAIWKQGDIERSPIPAPSTD